jgi:hypothetical protein
LKFARQHNIAEQVRTQASSEFEPSPEDIPKRIGIPALFIARTWLIVQAKNLGYNDDPKAWLSGKSHG